MQQAQDDNITPLGAPYPVLIRGQSLRKTRALAPPGSTIQLDDNFDDAISLLDGTTRAASPVRSTHTRTSTRTSTATDSRRLRSWDAGTSSPLDEDFDLMTSSAGLTTELGGRSMLGSPTRSQKEFLSLSRSQGKARLQAGTSHRSPDGSKFSNANTRTTAPGSAIPHSPDRRTKGLHSRQNSGGPRFEVVKSQVVEDGPERTVTVSVWREQVAKPIGPNGETMSVHYYSADEVLPDGVPFRSGSTSRGEGSVIGSEAGDKVFRERITATTDFGSYHHPLPPNANQSEIYLYDQSTPRPTTPLRNQTYTHSHQHAVSPGSPTSQELTSTAPSLSFRAADNSISTVKSLPTIELEHILDSCDPSLVHVAPILAALGITREHHLKAVGRLSEETRDRQVREEALRLGMTVMEWAILLDRLQKL